MSDLVGRSIAHAQHDIAHAHSQFSRDCTLLPLFCSEKCSLFSKNWKVSESQNSPNLQRTEVRLSRLARLAGETGHVTVYKSTHLHVGRP